MHVLLRHGLGDEQSVGTEFNGFGYELVVGHLAAEVVRLYHVVAFQAIVSGEALHVHDGVDAHGVGVRARGGAYHYQRTAYLLAYEVIGLVHVPLRALYLGHMDGGIVHGVRTRAVAVEKGEALGQFLMVDH